MIQDSYSKGFIKIIGKINKETFDNVSLELSKLENEGVNYIDVLLTSPGGRYSFALDIALLFCRSKCEIHITGKRLVASAAIFILAAGDLRYADSKETKFWFHTLTEEITNECGSNSLTAFTTNRKIKELGEGAFELRNLCTKITLEVIDFLIERFKIDRQFLIKLLVQNKKIDSIEARRIGIIHAISSLPIKPTL